MKNLIKIKALLAGLLVIACLNACRKDGPVGKGPGSRVNVKQVNLVADTAGYNASKIDTNLVNAWGIAAVPNGPLWISSNHKGLSTIYDKTGLTLRATHPIPTISAVVPGRINVQKT